MATSGVNHNLSTHDEWSCASMALKKDQKICLIVGVALAAVAGVAAYYFLVHGLTMLDTASSSLLRFGAGFMIYSGVVFSVVAVGNALYTGCKLVTHDEEKREFKYTPKEAKYQVAISIFAPVAVLPAVIVLGLGLVGLGAMRR